jgi:hypothetical protein
MQVMQVPEAVQLEYELHKLEAKDRIVFMTEAMRAPWRAGIWASRDRGCVSTKHEHFGNYVPSKIPYRYNAFIYLDETSALHPIHMKSDEIKCRKRSHLSDKTRI